MMRKLSRLPGIVIFGVAAVILLYSAGGVVAGECTTAELEQNRCFKTASGYSIRIVDNVLADGVTCGTVFPVNGFPTDLTPITSEEAYGWCYEIFAPALKIGSISQINLQSPLSFYDSNANFASALVLPSTIYSPFTYTGANGCLGDTTTGFEVGDREDCGLKWSVRVNPTGSSTRFFYKSKKYYDLAKTRPVPFDVGVKIMAPKVGNSLEPGFILGARALLNTPAYTPQANYMCEQIGENYYKITLDDFGCPNAIYDCLANSGCTTGCNPLNPEIIRARLVDKSVDPPKEIMKTATLREIGDLYGNRFCPGGHVTFTGSYPCSCNTVGGRVYCLPTGCTKQ